MKEIKWIPIYEYSCKVCGLDFKSKKELKISSDTPICSSKCIFRFYYDILSNYDKKDLLYLAKLFQIKDYAKLEYNKVIYEVCKKYSKPSLSSINLKRTQDRTGTGQDKMSYKRTEDRTTPPLYNKGVDTVLDTTQIKEGVDNNDT